MDCIGEDVTRELEYEPAKLEAHIHVRPKYACRRCKDGVSCGSASTTADSGRHRRAWSDHGSVSSASSVIICRCIVWKTFSAVTASTSREAPCAIG